MAWYPIGESSYGDLRGQMQYVNSERIAQQWLSLVRDFWERFGYRLSPNEGRRSKARCEALYANYLRNGYPVAAALYLSRHYEGTHGNAIDAGVTLADGSNRALTDEEFAWLHEQCELRGFTWTGRNFGEPWHIEGATRTEHFPPYPGITVGNALSSSPKPQPAQPPKPEATTPVGDIVNTFIIRVDNRKGAYDSYLINPETMRILHLNGTQETYWANRGLDLQKSKQPPQVIANFEKVGK